ncbi:hypothetical protein niasHT_010630 [Heterodera trifolii]|uniref:Uncharacterized protein n=1 Tax=Heterodera trifolii TaxID=157864 RepID=A0ABD2L951_9BILA
MTNGAVEWPSHAIAEPILHWIGISRPANNQAQARVLHNALQNTSTNLPALSSSAFLLDVYMPGQSDLLFALFLIGVTTAVCLLLLLIVFFILCTSRRNGIISCGTSSSNEFGVRASSIAPSSASGVDAFSTDEKPRGRMQCQRVLLFAVCAALWACLAFACALYACALGELASPPTVGQVAAAAAPPAEQTGDELQQQEDSETGGRFGRDNNNDATAELLRKFEDVRELGYQFHALLSPGAPTLFLLFFVFIFYLTSLVLSLFATLIAGMNRGPSRLYLPTGDHHIMMSATARAATAASSRRARVRRTLACSAVAFLCAAPLMLALGSMLLVQAHAHLALCVQEEQTAQDLAIAHYVSANFGKMPPSPSVGIEDLDAAAASIALPEFLADLKAERITVNMENCRTELAPINVLWLSSMLLALASVPFCLSVLALLITAKCWSTDGDGAGGISLRAYLPGWVQNSALGPDAYKSLAPVVAGGQYQHYSISSRHCIPPPATTPPGADASQSSFGTFVYKKY